MLHASMALRYAATPCGRPLLDGRSSHISTRHLSALQERTARTTAHPLVGEPPRCCSQSCCRGGRRRRLGRPPRTAVRLWLSHAPGQVLRGSQPLARPPASSGGHGGRRRRRTRRRRLGRPPRTAVRLWLGHATGQRLARRGSHSRGGRRRPSRGRIRRPPAAAVRLQLRHPARHMQRVRKHAAARPVRKQLMRVAGLVLMRAASSRRGRGERDASRRPRKHRGRRRRAGSQCEGLRPWHAGRVRCQRTGRAS